MTKTTHAGGPAIILFGSDDADKPRAAIFDEPQAEVAIAAAGRMGLRVLKLATAEQRDFAVELPAGRIHANGRGFVPFIRKDLYARLVELAERAPAPEQQPGEAGAQAEPAANVPGPSGRFPRTWDEIDVGHLVIAQESPADGWFEAIVIAKEDDLFTLRWRDYPRQKNVVRHRLTLALLSPTVW
jgi:hypothetical protein